MPWRYLEGGLGFISMLSAEKKPGKNPASSRRGISYFFLCPGPPPVGYFNAGAAYIFDCSSIPCEEVSKLESRNKTITALFGSSVGIDGTTIVVGAEEFQVTPGSRTGAVFVFDCPTFMTCSEESMLAAPDGLHSDRFGRSVLLSEGTLVVGAPFRDESFSNQGAVYIFSCPDPSSCSQESKLVLPSGKKDELFGLALALRGSLLAVAAPYTDRKGAVYLFDCSSLSSCSQLSMVYSSAQVQDNTFGSSVAIEGDVVVVGAPGEGAVYLFDCTDPFNCTEESKLVPSDAGARFGTSVSTSSSVIVVGANSANIHGTAYVFYCSSAFSCTEAYKLFPSDGSSGDLFGDVLAISGTSLAISSIFHDYGGASISQGKVYFFQSEFLPFLPLFFEYFP